MIYDVKAVHVVIVIVVDIFINTYGHRGRACNYLVNNTKVHFCKDGNDARERRPATKKEVYEQATIGVHGLYVLAIQRLHNISEI